MQHPDEGTIQAWLDGELTSDEMLALEQHVADCAECSGNVAEARGLMAAASNIVRSLDSVPRGVIPVPAQKQRSWFASAQLRAAAAVVVVAGASLLVARGMQEPEWRTETATVAAPEPVAQADRAASATDALAQSANSAVASSARQSEKPNPSRRVAVTPPSVASSGSGVALSAPQVVPAAPTVSPPPFSAPSVAQRNRSENQREERAAAAKTVESASQTNVPASPIPLPTAAVSGVRKSEPAKRFTGALTAGPYFSGPPPVVLRRDSTAAMIRTTYMVSQGIEVTLVENTVSSFEESAAADRAPSEPRDSWAISPLSGATNINSISWILLNDRRVTLSGPLTVAELELVKARLPASKRERVP